MTAKTHAIALLTALSTASLAACDHESADIGEAAESVSGRASFEVFRGSDRRFYFHMNAANHETILASQGYQSRTSALGGLLSVLDNAVDERSFDLRQSSDGQYYFNLSAANGRVIATSETYSTRASASRAIDGVIENVGDYLAFLASRRGARFVVFEGSDGRYYFQLRAANGAVVLRSQSYSSEASALNGTFSVSENGIDIDNYVLNPSSNGGFYFYLEASNGQVIGTSEVYSTRSNAERACDSIAELLPRVALL